MDAAADTRRGYAEQLRLCAKRISDPDRRHGRNVGNMPAELCNVIAPLFDEGTLRIERAAVSFVEPISRRSRHAKQAILFVEMRCSIDA